MLSTIPYTALLSPTPIFSNSSIAVLMFWPWPPMHVDAHTTLYTLHSIPYTALLGPIPIFSSSSIAFLMFWPSPLMHVKDRPYLTLHSLHSSPPTFTLQTPVLNLTPIFSRYSSSSIAFLLFWPPQCTPLDGPGGNRTPPSPNCHGTSAAKPTTVATPNGWGTASNWSLSARLPPRPPILTSFAMSNFSQAWQLAFVICNEMQFICSRVVHIHLYPHDVQIYGWCKSYPHGFKSLNSTILPQSSDSLRTPLSSFRRTSASSRPRMRRNSIQPRCQFLAPAVFSAGEDTVGLVLNWFNPNRFIIIFAWDCMSMTIWGHIPHFQTHPLGMSIPKGDGLFLRLVSHSPPFGGKKDTTIVDYDDSPTSMSLHVFTCSCMFPVECVIPNNS